MPAREYLVDGDQGFIGLNSRDNPLNLGKSFVSKSQNFRLDRGVAVLRKGAKRITTAAVEALGVIYGACTYTTATGVEYVVLVLGDKICIFDPDSETVVQTISFPNGEVITSSDPIDVYQAQGVGYVYICRGFSKTTLRWNGTFVAGSIHIPGVSTHKDYPNSVHAVYYGNRHIVQIDQNTIKVSHYLADNGWSSLDMFSINDGSSDALVGITPWTLNEFIIFMRNSIMYASVGIGANLQGEQAQENDSYVKSLAVDIGCIARKSAVQAGGGIIFLSDNGVYILNPQGAAPGGGAANTPEGVRILTLAEPLSSTINDVISRINFNHVSKAVAVYWENRYYLAVPLDTSTKNNAILVYNFINKAWESVDIYPTEFNVKNFIVSKRGNKRRVFAVDQELGLFLMEELDWDEYGAATALPILPLTDEDTFVLDTPSAILQPSAFKSYQIQGELITRAYSFETNREKRFSGIQVDTYAPAGGVLYTNVIVTNPDTETELIRYGISSDEGTILRLPVRKCGQYIQGRFLTTNSRPSVYSTTLSALVIGYTNKSQK
jgi:hypothetical protein